MSCLPTICHLTSSQPPPRLRFTCKPNAMATMTDEEREKLAVKLDADLEAFVAEKIAETKEKPSRSSVMDQTAEELAEELNQHPAFMQKIDLSKPLTPEVEGLMAMKYESDSAQGNAESFKEDGNLNFKVKKYRWAIDNYTAGIKCRCADRLLNAILYSNRAAANIHLGNYRSALNDCTTARKFKPDHMKAVVKGVQCCVTLGEFEEGMKWCDFGLRLNPNDEVLLKLRDKADKLYRQKERDRRKELKKEQKQQADDRQLLAAIQQHGVKLIDIKDTDDTAVALDKLSLSSVESHHPSGARVTQDSHGVLHWPVLFLYPEHGETDFIMQFSEKSSFADQLEMMFPMDGEPQIWDKENKYRAPNCQIFFEDREKDKLYPINMTSTLESVLKNKRLFVRAGTPTFILVIKDSSFAKHYLSKHGL
ncbi:Tetratricopeptide repeat protein 4 [Lamellibrachia satsuma]|nr:Tetratricopeptide repeat protein 4 [Lamellibrachia satsuma]